MSPEEIASIVEQNDRNRGGLISTLEQIQLRDGYLSEDALRVVAEKSRRSLVDVYGVATFYKSFSLKPRGKHLVSVCLGTACHVRGGPMILEEFERRLKVRAGDTTPDGEYTLASVNCLGACALGPIVVMDGHYFSNVATAKVKDILKKARAGMDKADALKTDRVFPVEARCSRCNHTLMDPEHLVDGHPSIRLTCHFSGKHGWLRLSSLYGSYTVESKHEIPLSTIVDVFCPHCHSQLIGAANCPECGAAMVPMIVDGGGMVQICSRKGCKGHMLDVNGVNF